MNKKKSLLDIKKLPSIVMDIHIKKGNILLLLGRFKEAEKSYTIMLQLAKGFSESTLEGIARTRLGRVLYLMASYKRSLEHLKHARAIFENQKERKNLALCWETIGCVHRIQGRYGEALKCHNNALQSKKEVGDEIPIANSMNTIGHTYWIMGKHDEALKYLRKALPVFKKFNFLYGESVCLNNLGLVYSELKLYEKAEKSYGRSLMIRRKIGDLAGIAAVYLNSGLVYCGKRKFNKAIASWKETIIICEKTGARDVVSMCQTNLGEVYIIQKKYDRAIKILKDSLKIKIKLNLGAYLPSSYTKLATAHYLKYQEEKRRALLLLGKKYADKAFSEAQKIGHKVKIREAKEILETIKQTIEKK